MPTTTLGLWSPTFGFAHVMPWALRRCSVTCAGPPGLAATHGIACGTVLILHPNGDCRLLLEPLLQFRCGQQIVVPELYCRQEGIRAAQHLGGVRLRLLPSGGIYPHIDGGDPLQGVTTMNKGTLDMALHAPQVPPLELGPTLRTHLREHFRVNITL